MSNYVDNDTLIEAIVKYKEQYAEAIKLGKPEPPIPNYIGSCFLKIAEGVSHLRKFNQYSYLDEMVSDGVENCIRYFKNYDPEISRYAFAYFTRICLYAFIRRIEKEKKSQYIKYKVTQQYGIEDFELGEDEEGHPLQFELYGNISEFIENYETTKAKKKLTKKKPKGLEVFIEELPENT